MSDEQIPWGLSDINPSGLITSKDMTPEQKEIAIRGNEAWIRLGLATRNKCSRCRYYYEEPSLNCVNVREHAESVENLCEVFVDLGIRCGKPISRVVVEPFTPGRFQIKCCDDCAESFIQQGYIDPRIKSVTAELSEGLEARDEAIMADIEKGSSKVVEDVVANLDSKPVRKKKVA